MSAGAPQVECRLCGTLYPDTLRFCPNCREPSPQVHEDLLMAARLTGVSYEILLQRAWAEEGLVRVRRAATPAQPEARPAQRRARRGRGFIERVRRHQDAALIGCLAVIGLATLAIIGLLIAQLLDDGDDAGPGESGIVVTPAVTQTPDAATSVDRATAAPTSAVGGGDAPPAASPTPSRLPLILDTGQRASYADGYSVRILSYDDQVLSPSPDDAPAPGFRHVAIEVEACGGEQTGDTAPGYWRLELPGGEIFEPASLRVEPALTPLALPPGGCAAGWVSFEVPEAPAPATIVHVHPGYDVIRFAWPG